MDKNTENDTKNFEECDGLDILASYERLYPPDNFETLQDIPTPYRSGDNAQNDKNTANPKHHLIPSKLRNYTLKKLLYAARQVYGETTWRKLASEYVDLA